MMKPKINFLKLENVPIFQQLQLEEALLRADNSNWCLVNEGSSPAIVMGISGKAELLIDFRKLNQSPLPVVRRFSGGGTVVVDENTIFVTMICNADAVDIPSFPNQILCWNGSLYEHPLRGTDFNVAENDYAIGTKKFGGNAQYICKDRWLHHSTLLWDYDPERMSLLKIPPNMPRYRNKRSHEDFLCRLSPFLKSKTNFYSDFRESLSSRFQIEPARLTDVIPRLDRPHRKATVLL